MRKILSNFVFLAVAWSAAAAQNQGAKVMPGEGAKSKEKTPEFAWPELAILEKFAGPWNVAESHFNAKGDVVWSVKGIEEGTWVLDRRVMRRTYTTGDEGNLYRAIGMITWDPAENLYKGTWFDNASATGPTPLTGTWEASSSTMTFTLASRLPDGKILEHKVTDRFLDGEHRIVTTFKVSGNQVEKVLEVQFSRAHPCPANVGIVPEMSKPGGSK